MPFTFSHPAVVLPLGKIFKKELSATALVIGSMAPDFEYFFRLEQESIYSHTWPGVFWFDLPVGLILYFLFTSIVKNPLIYNLPAILNVRFSNFLSINRKMNDIRNLLIVITSLLTGITSHLIWDKLTHQTVKVITHSMRYYNFLWEVNSLIAAIFIAVVIWRMKKGKLVIAGNLLFFWSLVISVILVVLAIRFQFTHSRRDLGVTAISGFLIGLLMSSLFVKPQTHKGALKPNTQIS